MINPFESPEELETRIVKLEEQVEILRTQVSLIEHELTIIFDLQDTVASLSTIKEKFDKLRDALY